MLFLERDEHEQEMCVKAVTYLGNKETDILQVGNNLLKVEREFQVVDSGSSWLP